MIIRVSSCCTLNEISTIWWKQLLFCSFVSLDVCFNIIYYREGYHSTYSKTVFQPNGYSDRVSFANNIIICKIRKKCGYHYRNNIKKGRKWGHLTLSIISEHVTLLQLLDTVGSVNHALSIFVFWVYDLNHKKGIPLVK